MTRSRRVAVALLCFLALAGCGDSGGGVREAPYTLPVGSTEWDVTAPAWFQEGTLHVGERTVTIGPGADQFVLGRTGVYWMRGGTLMFTSAEGATEKVEDVGWGNIAVSADRSVFATVDQSHGPKDGYGTRVLQVVAFDTRTGEQLYRTPDEKPDPDDDLADLYGEIMPLLQGVSTERLFFYGTTIDLADGSAEPATTDGDGIETYPGLAETLFPDGYHVGVRAEGRRRVLTGNTLDGVGLLSPDRSTIFDIGTWPTPARVYDAKTGQERRIDAPWDHFSLAGWTDADTFFGVAEKIDMDHPSNVLRVRQVVSCELRTLACAPVSPVIPTDDRESGKSPSFLVEGAAEQL